MDIILKTQKNTLDGYYAENPKNTLDGYYTENPKKHP